MLSFYIKIPAMVGDCDIRLMINEINCGQIQGVLRMARLLDVFTTKIKNINEDFGSWLYDNNKQNNSIFEKLRSLL